MAYPVAQNDIAQITIEYEQLNTVRMMNVLHYRYIDTTTMVDGRAALLRLAQYIDSTLGANGWSGAWKEMASELVSIDGYVAQKVYPIRYAPVRWDVTVPGAIVGQPLPSLVQWSITKRGEEAGRHNRGGIRVPGLPEIGETAGILTPAYELLAADLASRVPRLAEVGPSERWEPIIYRRLTPSASARVAEAQFQRVVRSQRTRISFRGI